MARDSETRAHQEWLGYLQPVGLVVSPPALAAAQAFVNRNIAPDHARFLEWVVEVAPTDGGDPVRAVTDLPGLLQDVFGWEAADLAGGDGGPPLPADLELVLPEYNETLRPSYAVAAPDPEDAAAPWQLLIKVIDTGADLDAPAERDERRWQASPHARFERLLREKNIPIGLLVNGAHLRLVYAPRGETSGYLTFPVQAMSEVDGRPIFAALHLLLSADRLFTLPTRQRLPALLEESRKYQNEVSTKLAGQVLEALWELLRGFQAADGARNGTLLREVVRRDPDHVYGGLLTVLLRLVFVLYAEDRGLMPGDPVYANHYAVTGLFERLRAEAGRYPDTMHKRYGAWAQLLALFRLIHDGGGHGALRLPARKGHLFDPDRYPFLEGRPYGSARVPGEAVEPPLVPDGVVYRVLEGLLILDGERLSYRTLDVEQIGSVYEAIMGFTLEVAQGRSIAIRPAKAHGAPVSIDLDALLAEKPAAREKRLQELTDQKVSGEALKALKDARTPEDVVAALGRKVAPSTPHIVPPGAMLLQPTDERRRTGSHYTPRALTEPIVRNALAPVLRRLGERPTPAHILDLKVCDPAMGSGAFLVESCRQLADALVEAWAVHGGRPPVPADEDEVLLARRLVAQRCLYGVDKNPLAVDLSKLSLWLATLARDHPFTFLDHALRAGDSLVGLTRKQIIAFHWEPAVQTSFAETWVRERIEGATRERRRILEAGDAMLPDEKTHCLLLAEDSLDPVRAIGDAVIAAFFSESKRGKRIAARDRLAHARDMLYHGPTADYTYLKPFQEAVATLRAEPFPVTPFHWEIEFPEAFLRENPGFDAFVGNPPFAGHTGLADANRDSYTDYLRTIHEGSAGKCDVAAHFFRRAFDLLRPEGAFGLIATNTIGQGDTRASGLGWICTHGGAIYHAVKRLKWPGLAAVVVSVVHVFKGAHPGPCLLDGREVPRITAFLFHAGGHENPATLRANQGKSFQGSIVLGMGFTFDDTDKKGVATPLADMRRLIAANPRNAEVIFPYIGGEEINTSPTHAPHRYVINFGERTEEECRRNWPDLMRIVEDKVRPERMSSAAKSRSAHARRATTWWQHYHQAKDLYAAIRGMDRVLANSQVSARVAFAFQAVNRVFAHTVNVYALSACAAFAVLQSRPHEFWARFFGSSLEDRLRYTPTDCFETFPFPEGFERNPTLEAAGKAYYDYRAALMVRNDEGLTKTYNRFHDPEEAAPEIAELRALHDAMDRAVLDAYGWTDLRPACEFLLDYEDEDADDEEADAGRARRRKKPWRWRWPDDVRDEVLARLLNLNAERAEEERLRGAAGEPKSGRPARGRRRRSEPTEELF